MPQKISCSGCPSAGLDARQIVFSTPNHDRSLPDRYLIPFHSSEEKNLVPQSIVHIVTASSERLKSVVCSECDAIYLTGKTLINSCTLTYVIRREKDLAKFSCKSQNSNTNIFRARMLPSPSTKIIFFAAAGITFKILENFGIHKKQILKFYSDFFP